MSYLDEIPHITLLSRIPVVLFLAVRKAKAQGLEAGFADLLKGQKGRSFGQKLTTWAVAQADAPATPTSVRMAGDALDLMLTHPALENFLSHVEQTAKEPLDYPSLVATWIDRNGGFIDLSRQYQQLRRQEKQAKQ